MQYQLSIDNKPEPYGSDKELLFKVVSALLQKKVGLKELIATGCQFQPIPTNDLEGDALEKHIEMTIKARRRQKRPHTFTFGRPQKSLRDVLVVSNDQKHVLLLQSCPRRLDNLKKLAAKNGVDLKTETPTPNKADDKDNVVQAGDDDDVVQAGDDDVQRSAGETKNPNVILYGPPGTGKTYATVSAAARLMEERTRHEAWSELIKDNDNRNGHRTKFQEELGRRIHFITFHQSYSYEDFIGGLRPNATRRKLQFVWQPGLFLRACAAAFKQAQGKNDSLKEIPKSHRFQSDEDEFLSFCGSAGLNSFKEMEGKPYPPVILVIDEINRANMSRVFGELITLLEDDKRLGGAEQLIVSLPNHPTGAKFGVPKNLIIIGTMNTADKSLALLDLALRRRFEFEWIGPKESELGNFTIEHGGTEICLRDFLRKLNAAITVERKSRDFGVGHAWFWSLKGILDSAKVREAFKSVLQRKVIPLLEEYFQGNHPKIFEIMKHAGIKLATESYERDRKQVRLIKHPVEIDEIVEQKKDADAGPTLPQAPPAA